MNRVVITGQGVISSIGKSVNEVYDSLANGLSGISILEIEDVDRLKVKSGGQIKDYDPLQFFEARLYRYRQRVVPETHYSKSEE